MQCASPSGRNERSFFFLPLLGAGTGSAGPAEASRASLEIGAGGAVGGDVSAT